MNVEINEDFESESLVRFDAVIDELRDELPELVENQVIVETAKHLCTEFKLEQDFFNDKSKVMLLLGIASRAEEVRSGGDGPDHDSTVEMMTLLGHHFSDTLSEIYQNSRDKKAMNEKSIQDIYARYTDSALTAELEMAIDNGLLDDLKIRLGIDELNETEFDIRVLSIAITEMPLFGLNLELNKGDGDLTDQEAKDESETFRAVNRWKRNMLARGSNMQRELGPDAPNSDAWVHIDSKGARTLCIASGFVERVLKPEAIEGLDTNNNRDYERAMAVIEHEYTHTQGGSNIDGGHIGVMLEELRAELFSGNNLGYQEVKAFFGDYRILTGHDIRKKMMTLEKGGTSEQVYAGIANTVGLSAMAEILFTLPNSYIEASNGKSLDTVIAKSLKGSKGVLSRIHDRVVSRGGEQDIITRAKEEADRIRTIVSKPESVLDLENVINARRRSGSAVVADILEVVS
jgi:hypothetical protein